MPIIRDEDGRAGWRNPKKGEVSTETEKKEEPEVKEEKPKRKYNRNTE